MFTVEHEFDLSKVTIMDENNNVDDFIIRFASDGIYFSQWVESENRYVSLNVSAKGLRVIDKKGIELVLEEIRARGEKI